MSLNQYGFAQQLYIAYRTLGRKEDPADLAAEATREAFEFHDVFYKTTTEINKEGKEKR